MFAIVLGALSMLLLLLSFGLAWPLSMVMSALALSLGTRLRHAIAAGRPGRESQARAAVTVAWISGGLAVVAGITWIVLAANGVSPQDLQETLERELERQRNRG